MTTKSNRYTRKLAAARSAKKREKDRSLKAASFPQITTALGWAARTFIAQARAEGRLDEVKPMLAFAMDRLRKSGFEINDVTASRIIDATSPNAPVTPSS